MDFASSLIPSPAPQLTSAAFTSSRSPCSVQIHLGSLGQQLRMMLVASSPFTSSSRHLGCTTGTQRVSGQGDGQGPPVVVTHEAARSCIRARIQRCSFAGGSNNCPMSRRAGGRGSCYLVLRNFSLFVFGCPPEAGDGQG